MSRDLKSVPSVSVGDVRKHLNRTIELWTHQEKPNLADLSRLLYKRIERLKHEGK